MAVYLTRQPRYDVIEIRAHLERALDLIDEEPREGMFGLQVAFVHPDSVHGVLAEVVAHG